jgi:hypothetical protein
MANIVAQRIGGVLKQGLRQADVNVTVNGRGQAPN